MLKVDETTLTGEVRAAVALARDEGLATDDLVTFSVAIEDLFRLSDDTRFEAAILAAMSADVQLLDPASIARARE